MYVIGCDVGSQSLKGSLLDPAGTVVAQASAAYDVQYPHAAWAQQDALDWRRCWMIRLPIKTTWQVNSKYGFHLAMA